jgi:uncharacterized protein YjiS (DUF1127 family)
MTTISRRRFILPSPRRSFFVPAGIAAACFDALLLWQERARQRHHLRELDDRMLRDLGLSRADIEREATKPFWRI